MSSYGFLTLPVGSNLGVTTQRLLAILCYLSEGKEELELATSRLHKHPLAKQFGLHQHGQPNLSHSLTLLVHMGLVERLRAPAPKRSNLLRINRKLVRWSKTLPE